MSSLAIIFISAFVNLYVSLLRWEKGAGLCCGEKLIVFDPTALPPTAGLQAGWRVRERTPFAYTKWSFVLRWIFLPYFP